MNILINIVLVLYGIVFSLYLGKTTFDLRKDKKTLYGLRIERPFFAVCHLGMFLSYVYVAQPFTFADVLGTGIIIAVIVISYSLYQLGKQHLQHKNIHNNHGLEVLDNRR